MAKQTKQTRTSRLFDSSATLPRRSALPLSFGLDPRLVLAQDIAAVNKVAARGREARASVRFGPDLRAVVLENINRRRALEQRAKTDPLALQVLENQVESGSISLDTQGQEAQARLGASKAATISSRARTGLVGVQTRLAEAELKRGPIPPKPVERTFINNEGLEVPIEFNPLTDEPTLFGRAQMAAAGGSASLSLKATDLTRQEIARDEQIVRTADIASKGVFIGRVDRDQEAIEKKLLDEFSEVRRSDGAIIIPLDSQPLLKRARIVQKSQSLLNTIVNNVVDGNATPLGTAAFDRLENLLGESTVNTLAFVNEFVRQASRFEGKTINSKRDEFDKFLMELGLLGPPVKKGTGSPGAGVPKL